MGIGFTHRRLIEFMSRNVKKRSGSTGVFGGKPSGRPSRSGSSSNRAGRRARRAENTMDIDKVIDNKFGKKLRKSAEGGAKSEERRIPKKKHHRGQGGDRFETRVPRSEERRERTETREQRSDDRRPRTEKRSSASTDRPNFKSSKSRNSRDARPRNSNGGQRNGGGRPQRGGRGRRVSQLNDFSLLVKKASPVEETKYVADRTFADMPLDGLLKQNLKDKGYESPSQIQNETLEDLLNGNDLIGVASTGTGKTAAFLIPIVEQLMQDPQEMTALVVVPTRELAQQVEQEFRSLTKGAHLFSSCFIGGTSVGADFKKARRRNHIIIGTPGRLKDMIDRKAMRFNRTPILVLDEFDRMLDMGFVNDIREIVSDMADRTQTMLFSATVEKGQEGIIGELMENPITVKVNTGTGTTDNVEQDIIEVPAGADKFEMLHDLISQEEVGKVLVFTETKRWADKVSTLLNKAGIRSDQIHGDKKQNYRMTALRKFKRGDIQVLVATDVAARGIDVQDVSHVVNYELPLTYDSYIHRIGRTGRAGKTGKAFTFVN